MILALEMYVWGRWISGPDFQRSPAGPTDPPTFMRAILFTWTRAIVVGFPVQYARFLAIFAACSAFFFVCYNVPAQYFALHLDPWPQDILKRSYFLMGICDQDTDRPCPDPALPVPLTNSGYINHEGKLVLPDGVQLPTNVSIERTK